MEITKDAFEALKSAAGIKGYVGEVWRSPNGSQRGDAWTLPNGIRLRTFARNGWAWEYHLDTPDEVFTEQHATTPGGYMQGFRPSEVARRQANETRSFANAIRARAERWASQVEIKAEAMEAQADKIRTEGEKNRNEAYALKDAR